MSKNTAEWERAGSKDPGLVTTVEDGHAGTRRGWGRFWSACSSSGLSGIAAPSWPGPWGPLPIAVGPAGLSFWAAGPSEPLVWAVTGLVGPFLRRRTEKESLPEQEHEQDQHDHDQDIDHQAQHSSGTPAGDPPRESLPPFSPAFSPARCTELNTKIRREPRRTEGAPELRSPLDALLLSIHGPLDLVAHYVVHPIRRDEELAVAVHRQP